MRQRIAEIGAALAFPIRGIDRDNGGAFLYGHLADYFLKRPKPVAFYRSRPLPEKEQRPRRVEALEVCRATGVLRTSGTPRTGLLNELWALDWNPFRDFLLPGNEAHPDGDGGKRQGAGL
jgi:hypothetical protein